MGVPCRSAALCAALLTARCPNSQVCEWALSLNLDASPFWDYGINGAVLVTLSDDDFRVSHTSPLRQQPAQCD